MKLPSNNNIIKYSALVLVTLASIYVWSLYFEKKNTPQIMVVDTQITDSFWKWEAIGRLNFIDTLLDNEILVKSRAGWGNSEINLQEYANDIAVLQIKSYGFSKKLKPAFIKFISLRGDANGLYIPSESTIYLNDRMQWKQLPFERFLEVLLHENMHHILTNGFMDFNENDPLRRDFEILNNVAFHQDGENIKTNPQEMVAYRSQRAARYAGIIGNEISVWDMMARMQEIKSIKKKIMQK